MAQSHVSLTQAGYHIRVEMSRSSALPPVPSSQVVNIYQCELLASPVHPSPLRGGRPRLRLPTVSRVRCIIPRVLGLLSLGLGGSRFGLRCRLLRSRGTLCGGDDIVLSGVGGRIAGCQRWCGLLGLGFVEERRFAGPSFIGEPGELLYLRLADEVLLLLFDGRGLVTGVTKPLVPLSYPFRTYQSLDILVCQ